jgi:hypothetical protein
MNAHNNANAEGASAIQNKDRTVRLAKFVERLSFLPDTELDLVDWILEGIENGVAVYGRFNPATDTRDLKLEAAKEFRDAFVYFAGDFMKQVLARRRRVECFRHDEAFNRVDEAMNPLVEVE